MNIKTPELAAESHHLLKRNPTIDIMRGLAICLMVLGHTDVPYVKFIYLFHMPFFFFISGYLFKSRDVETFDKLKKYLLKKVKTLWLPFFIGNGILTAFNNVFVELNLYTANPLFVKLAVGENNRLIGKMSFGKIMIQLIKNFFFGGESQLGGASWFLRSLFMVVVLNSVLTFLLCKLRRIRIQRAVFCVCVCMVVLLAQSAASGYFVLPGLLEGIPACFMAFMMGRLFRTAVPYKNQALPTGAKPVNVMVFFLSFLLLCLLCRFRSIDIGSGDIGNVFFFSLSLLSGTLFLYGIAIFIRGGEYERVSVFLQRCSKDSVYIIFCHFLSFKVITWIIIMMKKLPIILLAAYPVIDNPNGWSYAYFLAGIFIPLLICGVIKRIAAKIGTISHNKERERKD